MDDNADKRSEPTTMQVSADEFRAILVDHDLTDGNAAKIFDVTAVTIKQWLRCGLKGPAAVLVRLLLDQQIPPEFLAQRLNVRLSTLHRHQFDAMRAEK